MKMKILEIEKKKKGKEYGKKTKIYIKKKLSGEFASFHFHFMQRIYSFL